MLEHLRRQVCAALASTQSIVLSTWGPAGLQAATLACESAAMLLYISVPRTSDLLLNIEQQPEVLATTTGWQLRGRAHILPLAEVPNELALAHGALAEWNELVELRPTQLNILPATGQGAGATIDIW